MKAKGLAALACLLAGVPLLAWGLTHGAWLAIGAGLVLELVFLYFAFAWLAGANRPMGAQQTIKAAASAAWSMKDQPVAPTGNDKHTDK
jgi:hypothetical protein